MFLYKNCNKVKFGDRTILIDEKDSNVMPVMYNDTMMIPVDLFGLLEDLKYTGDEKCAEIKSGHTTIKVLKNNDTCEKNGEIVKLSNVPLVQRGHLYVSAADICEMLKKPFLMDKCGLVAIGEDIYEFNWENKECFRYLNYVIRDIVYEKTTPEEVISLLKKRNPHNAHPRLLLTENKIKVLRKKIVETEPYKTWMIKVKEEADRFLNSAETLKYELRDGVRLLYVSRETLLFVENMGFLYQMTGDTKYSDGVRDVLMKVCGEEFPDWHPYHFLDTAEMAAAVALGYDWCYDALTDDERYIIRKALVEKALIPVMEDYNEIEGRERTWYWSSKSSAPYPQNWVAVCFGGTTMAALAIGDENLGNFADAGKVITEGMEKIKDWMAEHMPDGVCPDGAGYWEFSMAYMAFGINAMETALGTDFSLANTSAFDNTFNWLVQMTGPAGIFNIGANVPSYTNSPEFFWYGAKSGNAALIEYRLMNQISEQNLKVTYKDILWYENELSQKNKNLAQEMFTRGVCNIISLRGGYRKDDTWLAMLCASEKKAYQEEASFVLDMLGERWALDLGSEWQHYVNFEVGRNSYYRCRAEGHNSIVVNADGGREYDLEGKGIIRSFDTNELSSTFTCDYTSLLKSKNVTKWTRAVFLDKTTNVITLNDELCSDQKMNLYWFMHTDAKVRLEGSGKVAHLSKNGKEIEMKLLTDNENVKFCLMPAEPLEVSPKPVQTENKGVQKLAVHCENVEHIDIKVKFIPIV